jgi:hypothetical protein
LTGTAIRPLSSTVCRYSPVNTVGSTPGTCRGLVVGVLGFPTSHHFVPLRCILRCESRHVKTESVLLGCDAGARVAEAAGRGASTS